MQELAQAFNKMIDQLHENQVTLLKALHETDSTNQEKDNFINNINHELRTPMNLLMGHIDLLKDSKNPEEVEAHIKQMDKSSQSLWAMINDLLDFSQLHQKTAEINISKFNVYHLCKNIEQIYSREAETKKIELICDLDPTSDRVVRGDFYRFQQIHGCFFIDKAFKVFEKNKIYFTVNTKLHTPTHSAFLFNISDSADQRHGQSDIFTYHKLADQGKRKFDQMGLGFDLAQKNLDLLRGNYGFGSLNYQGCLYWLNWNLKKRKALNP